MSEPASFQLVATAHDGQRIAVAVRRKQVRNLNLRVRTDGSVVLSIPLDLIISNLNVLKDIIFKNKKSKNINYKLGKDIVT